MSIFHLVLFRLGGLYDKGVIFGIIWKEGPYDEKKNGGGLRLLAIFASLMVVFAGAVPAYAATTLPDPQDGVITLSEDTTISEFPSIEGQLKVDLAGHTLTYESSATVSIDGGKALALENGTFRATKMKDGTTSLFNIKSQGSVALNKVTLITNGSALYPQGDAARVSVADSTIYCGTYCVATNAAAVDNYGVVINLQNSTFTTAYGYKNGDGASAPVLINIPCELTMDGCVVNGARQGVVVRGGTARIANSQINLTDTTGLVPEGVQGSGLNTAKDKYLTTQWGSGNEVPMAAMVVGNRSDSAYQYPTDVILTASTITAPDGYITLYAFGSGKAGCEVACVYDGASSVGNVVNPTISEAIVGRSVAEINGTPYASLTQAFASAKSGDSIKVLTDLQCDDKIQLTDKAVTLDLAGKTVKSNVDKRLFTIAGANAKLTIVDSASSGKISATKADPVILVSQGTLDFQSGTIEALGTWKYKDELYGADAVYVLGSTDPAAKNYSNVTIGKDATIACSTAEGVYSGYGIDINRTDALGNHAYGVNVDVNGTFINSGMYVNGQIVDTEGNVPSISLGQTANLDGSVYAAGYAVWNINGATIVDGTAFEIRAGVLNMTDGYLKGTEKPTSVDSNGNGSTTTGAGLAVAQHTTKLPIEVNISGGVIEGFTAFNEKNSEGNSADDLKKIKLNFTGGTFTAINEGTNAVFSENCKSFISGGVYSSEPAAKLIADGFAAVKGADGAYVVAKQLVEPDADATAQGSVALNPDPVLNPSISDKAAASLADQAEDAAQSLIDGKGTNGIVVENDKEIQKVASKAGDEGKVVATLVVDASKLDGAPEADGKLVEGSKAASETASYLDLSLTLNVKALNKDGELIDSASSKVMNLDDVLEITLSTGDADLSGSVRVARVHDGAVDFIPCKVDRDAKTVTFKTDRFSTYALLTSTSASIVFNSNGGSDVPAQQVAFGQLVVEPKSPVRDGYEFAGWFTDVACTQGFDFTKAVTTDTPSIVLYAKWTAKAPLVHTVTFVPVIGGDEQIKVEVNDGDLVQLVDEPKLDGWKFVGWFTDTALTKPFDAENTPITADIVLYGGWTKNGSGVENPGEKPSDPSTKPTTGLPSTGDTSLLPMVAVGAAGVIAVTAGVLMSRRRKSN